MPGIVGIVNSAQAISSKAIKNMVLLIDYDETSINTIVSYKTAGFGCSCLEEMNNDIYENDEVIVCFYGEVFEIQKKDAGDLTQVPLHSAICIYQYILKYGIEVISDFNGTFALAIYEKRSGCLTLANDRLSCRRLYYYKKDGLFVFASEAKAIFTINQINPIPDYAGITEFLLFRQSFNQRTFWEGVFLLPPATILMFDGFNINIRRYWDTKAYFKRNKVKPRLEYAKELYSILKHATKIRTPPEDIAMGLSGGLDSRTVLALLDKAASGIYSYTYGTDNCGDVVCAKKLAEVYHTNHERVTFSGEDLERYAKEIVWRTDGAADADLYFHIPMTLKKREKAKNEISSVGGDAVSGKYNILTVLTIYPPPHSKMLGWMSIGNVYMAKCLIYLHAIVLVCVITTSLINKKSRKLSL